MHAILNHRLDGVEFSFFFLFVGFFLTFELVWPCMSSTWSFLTAFFVKQSLDRFDRLLVSNQIIYQRFTYFLFQQISFFHQASGVHFSFQLTG
tara:strand:- start:2609 stop:2887 length:279 start_codon:yes stop_codon:yes gene_type:complete